MADYVPNRIKVNGKWYRPSEEAGGSLDLKNDADFHGSTTEVEYTAEKPNPVLHPGLYHVFNMNGSKVGDFNSYPRISCSGSVTEIDIDIVSRDDAGSNEKNPENKNSGTNNNSVADDEDYDDDDDDDYYYDDDEEEDDEDEDEDEEDEEDSFISAENRFLKNTAWIKMKGEFNSDDKIIDEAITLMVKKEHIQSAKLFEEAAKQGHMGAQYMLGEFYENGNGVNQNGKKAVYWYKKSALQGHGYAQYNLAGLYQRGDIIGRNGTKARYWYNRAYKQKNEAAIKYIYQLSQNYTTLKEACRDGTLIFLSIIFGLFFGILFYSALTIVEIYNLLGFVGGAVFGCIIARIVRLKL